MYLIHEEEMNFLYVFIIFLVCALVGVSIALGIVANKEQVTPVTPTPSNTVMILNDLTIAYSQMSLPRFKAARDSGNAFKILCLGDSITQGNTLGVAPHGTYPYQLAQIWGNNASSECFFGPHYETNITCDNNVWIRYNVGVALQSTSANSILTYTPGIPVDSFKIYFLATASTSDMKVAIDANAPETVICSNLGSNVIVTKSISTTLNTHSLNISCNGSLGILLGIEAWDSSAKSLRTINYGWSGSATPQWVANISPMMTLPSINPDLVILLLGTNDFNVSNTPVTQFENNLKSLIQQCRQTSEVIIMTFPPCNAGPDLGLSPAFPLYSEDLQATYHNTIRSVALETSTSLFDMNALFVDFDTAYASGYMHDNLHPNSSGQQYLATNLARFLKSL